MHYSARITHSNCIVGLGNNKNTFGCSAENKTYEQATEMVVYSYSGIWVSGKLQSIRRSFRILRRSKSDAVVRRVIHRIIALEERVPADEVKPRSTICTEL